MSILLVTANESRWQFGVGDPTFLGWLTFAAYLGAAFACFRALRTSRFGARTLASVAPHEAANQRTLGHMWLGVGILMALLGLNKQIDLQSLGLQIGRDLATTQGWYEHRQRVQVLLLVALAIGSVTFGIAIMFGLRRVLRRVRLALVGLSLIGNYVFVRAATFNHLDVVDAHGIGSLIWILEFAGIALVTFAARHATMRLEDASR